MKERNKLHARKPNNNSQTLLVYFFSYLKRVCSTWDNYRVNSSKIRKPLVFCQRVTGNLVTHFSWLPVLLLRKAIGIVIIYQQWSSDFFFRLWEKTPNKNQKTKKKKKTNKPKTSMYTIWYRKLIDWGTSELALYLFLR